MTLTTYFITGATGYLGSQIIKYLTHTEEYHTNRLRIMALIRHKEKAQQVFSASDDSNLFFIEKDLLDSNFIQDTAAAVQGNIDYLIHCAAATQSAFMLSHPVETADSIVFGTKNVLELARLYKVKSMVYLSSMEVYGKVPDKEVRVTEEELGDMDILSVRSCYPLGKRMAEQYCSSYHKEYQVPVKIARLAQTFGTGVSSEDNRVFAQFSRAVRKGQDIVLHTEGTSMGNYVDSEDAVRAVFTILKSGRDGEAYNVVNEANTMRIGDMARLVADRVADGRIKVVYDIPEENSYGYAPVTGLRLSSAKLKGLGWQPGVDLEEMYRKMIGRMDSEDRG